MLFIQNCNSNPPFTKFGEGPEPVLDVIFDVKFVILSGEDLFSLWNGHNKSMYHKEI